MSKLIDKIEAAKAELKVLTDKRSALLDEKFDKIAIRQKELEQPIMPKYELDSLVDAGLRVSIGAGININGEGVYLDIAYESYRAHCEDKKSFNPNFVRVDLSTTGYGWRMRSNDTIESMNTDLDTYIKSARDFGILATWMKDKDFCEIARTINEISNQAQDEYEDYNRAEMDKLLDQRSIRMDELVDEIFNSISEGDDVSALIYAKSKNINNGMYRGRSVSSIPVFDKLTQKGEGFRVIHTLPEDANSVNTKQTLNTADVKTRIAGVLRHS